MVVLRSRSPATQISWEGIHDVGHVRAEPDVHLLSAAQPNMVEE
jgi:hypothetical protein